jgi:glycosyltransferase involved in cell wall biosynthesis
MWTADAQRQIGLALKKYKNIVVAYELHKRDINLKRLVFNRLSIITKREGVYFFTPIHLFPFERFRLIYELNKKLSVYLLLAWVRLKFGLSKKIILWLFHPREVWLIKEFRRFLSGSLAIIFDCVDYFAKGSAHEMELLTRLEKKLAKEADIVLAVSRNLQNYLRTMRKDVVFAPQGFRIHDFQKPKRVKLNFPKNSPIIGYVGGLNDRLDLRLLLPLVTNNPRWNFVFWGPLQDFLIVKKPEIKGKIESLLSFPNVLHGESKNKREIPSIISQFDVCIIPYDTSSDFNKFCFPIKLFEYFYEGKPVVSTPIKELKYFTKYVTIGSGVNEWQALIENSLTRTWPNNYKAEQKKIAKNHSWERRLQKISKLIEAHPQFVNSSA